MFFAARLPYVSRIVLRRERPLRLTVAVSDRNEDSEDNEEERREYENEKG